MTLDPKQNGEKALTIDYEFKMELDKNVNIGGVPGEVTRSSEPE